MDWQKKFVVCWQKKNNVKVYHDIQENLQRGSEILSLVMKLKCALKGRRSDSITKFK
jgi:hypothetical protein